MYRAQAEHENDKGCGLSIEFWGMENNNFSSAWKIKKKKKKKKKKQLRQNLTGFSYERELSCNWSLNGIVILDFLLKKKKKWRQDLTIETTQDLL